MTTHRYKHMYRFLTGVGLSAKGANTVLDAARRGDATTLRVLRLARRLAKGGPELSRLRLCLVCGRYVDSPCAPAAERTV